MKASYYPGCSLNGTALEYNESLKSVAGLLGLQLQELPDWTCCGASSAHVTADRLAVSLAGRNLLIADKMNMDLLVPCAACFNRLKAADKALKAGQTVQGLEQQYQGRFNIKHSADFIWDNLGETALAAKITRRLTGLSPVCYYGCLTVRPPKITDAADPDNPVALDEIMRTLGADVRNWSFKTDCCGGNLMLTHPDLAMKMVKKLFDMALEAGANCLVVSCPMCQSNLDTRQKHILNEKGLPYNLPVYYFTELMALAYGDSRAKKYINQHLTNAESLLVSKGLL